MAKIENFFLVSLLIAISLLVFILVNDAGKNITTGFSSFGTATTSVNLLEIASVAITGNIDFGAGRVDVTAINATLDSDEATVAGGTWNASLLPQYIKVENDGTVNISVNVSADGNNNAQGFIGGTSPLFQIKGKETEPGACVTLQTTYANVPNSTETPLAICDLLQYVNSADEFNVSAKLVIPSDAAPGQRNVTLTFSVSKV